MLLQSSAGASDHQGAPVRPTVTDGPACRWRTATYDRCVELRLRLGDPADQGSLLSLFDEVVSWLTARGLEGQWGSQPWSQRPERQKSVLEMTTNPGLTIAEIGHDTVGALIISDDSPPYVPVASEPELYVDLLLVSRRYTGRRIGSVLLDYARSECRNRGRTLLRVDCWAGGNRELVRYYERAGFTPTDAFRQGDWPGQLLVQQLP
jgi:GNAT superfamily N-acetyltransferase